MIGSKSPRLTPDDYEKWTRESTSGMSLAQNGERLFASHGLQLLPQPAMLRRADPTWPASTVRRSSLADERRQPGAGE